MISHPLLLMAAVLLAVCPAQGVELKTETAAAFDHYVRLSEQRMQHDLRSGRFLWMDDLPTPERQQVYQRIKQGDVVTEKLETLEGAAPISVPGGLIHHWIGTVFIPGANLKQTLALLQNYDEHAQIYAPHVLRSKLIQHTADDFKFSLRLHETKVVTVVLDTDYDAHYLYIDSTRACSRSYSTRVAEVEKAGQPDEREKPVSNDSGFLWRLNSYWRFQERDGGVYVQLEAVSLTRDIPEGLGWLIRPFITSIPKESLMFTLSRTREALSKTQK
jgi:hypothetical protein